VRSDPRPDEGVTIDESPDGAVVIADARRPLIAL
jgi:hypothetical protein